MGKHNNNQSPLPEIKRSCAPKLFFPIPGRGPDEKDSTQSESGHNSGFEAAVFLFNKPVCGGNPWEQSSVNSRLGGVCNVTRVV